MKWPIEYLYRIHTVYYAYRSYTVYYGAQSSDGLTDTCSCAYAHRAAADALRCAAVAGLCQGPLLQLPRWVSMPSHLQRHWIKYAVGGGGLDGGDGVTRGVMQQNGLPGHAFQAWSCTTCTPLDLLCCFITISCSLLPGWSTSTTWQPCFLG